MENHAGHSPFGKTGKSIVLELAPVELQTEGNSWDYHGFRDGENYAVLPSHGPEDKDSAGNDSVYVLSPRDGSRVWVPRGKYRA